jgi:hypothetical protein
MKKLKMLTAAVLAAALILTSMTAVFAADASAVVNADRAATLRDLGLYSGQDANDPRVGLEDALTTQDSLIFLAKLFGYFETASTLTDDQIAEDLAKFDDAASISDYAKKVVAYSAANGILSGSTDGERIFVGAKDTVTSARFATFMLKQMGYTVDDFKQSVTKLADTRGSRVDATLTGDLTRDAAVGVMYDALTAEKRSGKTVIADIVGDNADLRAKAEELGLIAPPVTTDVAVVSVNALNCKQVAVLFNQEMNMDSVESEDFYEICDKGENKVELGDSSASLDADRKTVIITLNKKVDDKLTNFSKAKVIVKKDVLALRGVKLAEDAIFENVEVQDGLLPTVTKVEATGERNMKITFSEPVYDKGNDDTIATTNFKIVSGTYEYYVQKATLDNNVINLSIRTSLVEGPVTVTVNKEGINSSNAIVDYAGYAVFKDSKTFDYVKDTSVAVVTVKSARANKVVLSFSKPVKGSKIRLYHTVKNATNYKAEATKTDYVDEITFTFDTLFQSGMLKLFLVNSEAADENLVDSFGIKVPGQTLSCVVKEDVLPPEVTVKSAKDNVVVLNFSKPVKGSYIRLYHSVKNNESYMAEFTKTDYTDTITFIFSRSLPIGKLKLFLVNSETEGEGLTDRDGVYVPDQSLTCDVEEAHFPRVAPAPAAPVAPIVNQCIVNRNESIKITFNKQLDTETATNPDSYVVKKASDSEEIPLSASIDDSMKSVELKFDTKLEDFTEYQLLIKKYKDISGNSNTSDYKYNFTTSEYVPPEIIDDPESDQFCSTIPEKGTIIIIYSEAMNEVQMLDEENYQVSLDYGETYVALGDDSITKVDDRTVQIYFKELEGSDIKPNVKIAPITDLAGNRLYDSNEPYIVEDIQPERVYIEEAQLIAKNKIKVAFNKKMASESIIPSDFIIDSTTPGAISVIACEPTTVSYDGKTEVVLILNEDLATDAKDESEYEVSLATVNEPSSESEWGSKLRPYFSYLYDKTAPEVVMWDHDDDASTDDIAKVIISGSIINPQHYDKDSGIIRPGFSGTITIFFSEEIIESSLDKERTFKVPGFTIDAIIAPDDTKTVVLEVTASTNEASIRATVIHFSEIHDKSDNALAPGPSWQVTLDDRPITN